MQRWFRSQGDNGAPVSSVPETGLSSDVPTTDLSDLARFQEAEEHRAELVAAFVHAAFRRSPHAKPLHPVPTTQPVILHYMHGKPPGADSKARPEAQGVSALHTVLVLSRGVWHNDKLYDAKATQAAALLAVQPALSGPSRVVKAAGLSTLWTFVKSLEDVAITFNHVNDPNGRGESRSSPSATIWLVRHIAPTGHPVKTNEGHEEGTIFIFMRGTDAEERHRRSAHGSIGNFRPETPKYAILVHSLLVGLDADKYDATEYELELVRGGSSGLGPQIDTIVVYNAFCYNRVKAHNIVTVDYNLPRGHSSFRAFNVVGHSNEAFGAQYEGQQVESGPSKRSVETTFLCDMGTSKRWFAFGNSQILVKFKFEAAQ